MACDIESLKRVPLFALLDNDELAVLAGQVEFRQFKPRQRIWKIGDEGGRGYVILSGMVQVKTIDEDNQEVLLEQPGEGEIFGFASMLDGTAHQTEAVTIEACECIEVDRNDIGVLLERKPHAGLDMMSVLGRQFHNAQKLVKLRAARNPNDVIEERETVGERVADLVAAFGGSWTFIIIFATVLVTYSSINVKLGNRAWDPYPFILLNLFLSMLAAVQAPIIMMSQNRQDKKDRLRSELDYEVNRRAHSEIQGLAKKLNFVGEKLADLEETIREKR